MNKTVLELINEAFSVPDPDADASGYGFGSELNEPVNAVDSNHSMEPENIAAVYFNEGEEEDDSDGDRTRGDSGDDENLLFDYETSEMISPEAAQDLSAYFNEDMLDISTIGKQSDGEIPPGGVMDEQDFKEPTDMGPSQLGLDKNMSVQKAMNKRIEEESIGLAESLLLLSSLK